MATLDQVRDWHVDLREWTEEVVLNIYTANGKLRKELNELKYQFEAMTRVVEGDMRRVNIIAAELATRLNSVETRLEELSRQYVSPPPPHSICGPCRLCSRAGQACSPADPPAVKQPPCHTPSDVLPPPTFAAVGQTSPPPATPPMTEPSSVGPSTQDQASQTSWLVPEGP
jgi:hypothetical protein